MSDRSPEVEIREVDATRDWEAIAEVFNHYVRTSPAAFPDRPVEPGAFADKHLAAPDYPFLVVVSERRVVGFAYLAPLHSAATLRRSAVLTYFIMPDFTGCGIGKSLLERLLPIGRSMGITNFLAHVSSLNEGSIRFHRRNGFEQCGRFRAVGRKGNDVFDMVWMQRIES